MSEYIQKRLNGVLFSFYTKEEIRKLSVVEVSNPMAFDKLNKPLKKGLYDPAMGISPYDKNSRCITCGLEGLNCTGHMGHVELAISIYNPLTMRYLHRILRAMCLNCHRIRIPKKRIDDFITMLLLIKLGYVNEKSLYQDACDIRIVKKKKEEKEHSEGEVKSNASTKPSQNNSSATSRKHSEMEDKETIFNNAVEAGEEKKRQLRKKLKALIKVKENPNFEVTDLNQTMVRAIRDTIQDIWSSIMSQKCPHCGSKPANVKLDSNTRFLVETKGDKEKIAKVLHTKKGYENLSDEEEEDDEEDREAKEQEKMAGLKGDSTQKMLNPLEVKEHIRLLWDNDSKLLNLIFGNLIINNKTLESTKKGYKIISNDWETFFMDVVPVTPNRFRPENKMGDMTFLHQHTVLYTNILEKNTEIKNILVKHKQQGKPEEKDKKRKDSKEHKEKDSDKEVTEPEIEYERTELTDTIRLWIQLQDAVNCLVDSSKALKLKDKEGTGIRQLLERKEGLFRMKMMGKRVNYSARSVISPDPYIDTNEVGVPMYVAKTLTFPEDVNQHNLEKLRKLIINGAHKWPGANYLEENGVKIALDTRTDAQREALAKTLWYNYKNKVVYRHLNSGDVMLFNRQPTLHKSSIMSHIARVLPKNNTIRNHYANCNTYNADFDGDEMNLHLLQNHLARAEAYTISNTANQYISPTHGRPLRGLIQDSIVSGFFLSIRDNFLEKEEYQQLVYATVWNVLSRKKKAKIYFMKPAILKPKALWTGKQVISSVLKTIIGAHNPTLNEANLGLNMNSKAKVKLEDVTKRRVLVEDKTKGLTQKIIFDEVAAEESTIIIRDNELLQGVIDKNQIGNSEFGLIHAFYEMYGGQVTETLLTCLARLLVVYLQFHGQTCGIDDLKMSAEFEKERRELVEQALKEGLIAATKFADTNIDLPDTLNLNNRPTFQFDEKGRYKSNVTKREPDVDYISVNNPIIKALHKKMLHEKNGFKDFDNAMKPVMGKQTSIINSAILPIGLEKQFPQNFFSVIVSTGAKGSNVNQNQVSGLLSQQELEGRRVPVLPSGKTLPCFLPYDPNPRAWGYITDRFISGVRPQDFYFHCMAGREGLIDTAVKTSVSGYLQRCLIKNMETLIVNYDFTVRDSSDGSVVQFYYGEDALDPCKTKYFEKFDFIEQNINGYIEKYNPSSFEGKLDQKSVKKFLKGRKKQTPEEIQGDTIMNKFLPGSYFGAVSESLLNNINKYTKDHLKVDEEKDITEKKFKSIVFMKYFNSLMHPGECVGALVGQAIGEPSTQMTLNTFHLAGHGGANVTLGIPRLREILFKGPRKVKTPMMTITLKREDGNDLKKRDAELITRKLQKLKMKELIKGITVKESKHLVKDGKILPDLERKKVYDISIKFEDINAIRYSFDLDMEKIKIKVKNLFVYNLLSRIGKELRKTKHSGSEIIMQKIKDNEEKKAAADTGDLDDNQSDEEVEEKEENKGDKKKKTSKSTKDKDDIFEARLSQFREYFQGLSFENEGNHPIVKIVVKVPLDSKKLLMVHIVENAINDVCISEIPGISNCHLNSQTKEVKGIKKEVHTIVTEGVNFPAMWEFDFVEKNSIDCNDISEIYTIYGVEAARSSISREIVRVFKPYGITVDPRHITLISDFITFGGRIRPLTREGIKETVSPLQKMSFEMASRFLTDAAMNCDYDALKTASAQIVLGKPPVLGTGMFDVMHKLENPVVEEEDNDAAVDEE